MYNRNFCHSMLAVQVTSSLFAPALGFLVIWDTIVTRH